MPVLTKDMVPGLLAAGAPYTRPTDRPNRFAVGERVRMRNIHPKGHTRLPRYVRGHVGEIVAYRGSFVFPDTEAHHEGENPQHMYAVKFDARELWGEDAPDKQTLCLEIFEDYMDKA